MRRHAVLHPLPELSRTLGDLLTGDGGLLLPGRLAREPPERGQCEPHPRQGRERR